MLCCFLLYNIMLLLLLLSRFSHVWFCATPWTAAHQAPLSMEFSRQECWSWVPLPSPSHSSCAHLGGMVDVGSTLSLAALPCHLPCPARLRRACFMKKPTPSIKITQLLITLTLFLQVEIWRVWGGRLPNDVYAAKQKARVWTEGERYSKRFASHGPIQTTPLLSFFKITT